MEDRWFLDSVKKDLVSAEFSTRDASNLALLAFDIGRAKDESEVERAKDEYDFRSWAFVCRNGLKEAMRLTRKYRRLK